VFVSCGFVYIKLLEIIVRVIGFDPLELILDMFTLGRLSDLHCVDGVLQRVNRR